MTAVLAAQQAASLAAAPRFGIVDRYDPNTYRAAVVLAPSPDGKMPLTGYMPVLTGYMGNGWGIVAPLQKGDQVIVLFIQNHPDQGVILGRIYDQPHIPPKRQDNNPAQPGEIAIRHPDGSLIQITNDRKVLINGTLEIDLTAQTVNIAATTEVSVTSPTVTTSGNMVVGAGASGSFTTPTGLTVTVRDGIVTNIF